MKIQLHVGTKADLIFNFETFLAYDYGRDYREKRIVISTFLALYIQIRYDQILPQNPQND